ncbi:MAG: helix-turn-helix transcriptional regulator [Actinomycetota bacterium]|nr:helix-turn-helix transcriptional regulator [Actinomycetota bacterium]
MKTDPVGQIVATNLRRLRQSRRWTLKETAAELAAQLGDKQLSEAGMSRWEDPANPRRYSMTELFAVCRVFGVPLARLFLPNHESEIPTVSNAPFYSVWEACFSGTEKVSTDWQRVEFVQRQQSFSPEAEKHALDGFTEDQIAEALELLRRLKEESADTDEGPGMS